MKHFFTKALLLFISFIAGAGCAQLRSDLSRATEKPVAKKPVTEVVKKPTQKAVVKKAPIKKVVAKTIAKKAPIKKTIANTAPVKKKTYVSSSKKTGGKDKHGMATYADSARTRYLRATAYSHKEYEKGCHGLKSAGGSTLKYGSTRSVAADWSRLPVGTKFKIKGKPGITYIVNDYGSALVGTNTIDMFHPDLKSMRSWGTRKVTIQIIQMGSWERSAKLLKGRLHASHCRKMYYAIKKKRGL